MERLFVYGTLCPGRANAHLLEQIGGEWLKGSVRGTLHDSGWGAALGFPAIVLDNNATQVDGHVFTSADLQQHWPMLDEFEAGYDRVDVNVQLADGGEIAAWVYQIQPAV